MKENMDADAADRTRGEGHITKFARNRIRPSTARAPNMFTIRVYRRVCVILPLMQFAKRTRVAGSITA